MARAGGSSAGRISATNSTSTPLGAGGVFLGGVEDTVAWKSVTMYVESDAASAAFGLALEWSADGAAWTARDRQTVAAGVPLDFESRTRAQYFRVRYTNGGGAQGAFRLQTIFHETPASPTAALASASSGVGAAVAAALPKTAFGELQVAEPTPVVQVGFHYNLNPDLVRTSGSVAAVNGLAVVSAAGGTSYLETRDVVKYNMGQGSAARFTAVFSAPAVACAQIIGVGDTTDGYFFGYLNTVFGVVRYHSTAVDFIPQASWNVDRLDGTGESRFTLNPQLGNVYQITYQWLGFGAIRFYVEEPESGAFVESHRIKYANSATATSIRDPTLPIRAAATSGGAAVSVSTASLGGFVQGKLAELGPTNAVDAAVTVTNDGNWYSLLALHNVTTFVGRVNRVRVKLVDTTVASAALARVARFKLFRWETLAAANAALLAGGPFAFTPVGATRSVIEYDLAATRRVDPASGEVLFSGALPSGTTSGATVSKDLSGLRLVLAPDEVLAVAYSVPAGGSPGTSPAPSSGSSSSEKSHRLSGERLPRARPGGRA